MDITFAKGIIENLLFVSNRPISIKKVMTILDNELSSSEIRKIFFELINEYSNRNIQLFEVAGGFQLSTRIEYSEWVKRFHKAEKASCLSKASLETLAIIAYKQSITRIEVDEIRGVDSAGTVRKLLEKNLIRATGKKKVLGRPMMYGTTRKFLEYFGLRSLSDLPTLEEFNERKKDTYSKNTFHERNSISPQG